MKRHVLFMTLILFFLSFAIFPPSAHSQEAKKPEKEVSRDFPSTWEEFLDLTPDQKSKLEEFRKKRQEERKESMKNMRAVRKELRELMRDPEANEKKILEIYDKQAKFRSDRFKKSIQHRKEIKKMLTPEQWEKLEKYKKRIGWRRDRFMGRKGFFRRGFFRQRFHRFWRRDWNF
ncbi:MAG: periplasmic heavy metal sensor [Candidatus Aminicenantes bacterium]|nr:periplasmic heavy metal sensor [Candidatus Aminicenantes bacterium]